MRLRLGVSILIVCVATLVVAQVAAAGTEHAVYSDDWQGITFVGGLDSCPLFGPAPGPLYVFQDVNLADRINSTYTPTDEPPLYQIDSVGTLHGTIRASDGTYRVSGGGFREDRVDELFPSFFSGTGQATISGPGGTVVGTATFQDLLGFPPPEFDLLFTGITACDLR